MVSRIISAITVASIIICVIGCKKTPENQPRLANRRTLPATGDTPVVAINTVNGQHDDYTQKTAQELGVNVTTLVFATTQLRKERDELDKILCNPESECGAIVSWVTCLSDKIDQGSDIGAKSGNKMSSELLPSTFAESYAQHCQSSTSDFMAPGQMGITSDNVLCAGSMYWAVQEVAKKRPDALGAFLKERADRLSLSAADIVICCGLASSEASVSETSEFNRILMDFCHASNPVYRLMSANIQSHIMRNESIALQHFSSFVGETDPLIKETAIEGVRLIDGERATSLLKAFRSQAASNNNTRIVNAVDRVLEER